MTDTLTTRDLPTSMQSVSAPVVVTRVVTLTCEHGPACPSCVLEAARRLVGGDASLTGSLPEAYKG